LIAAYAGRRKIVAIIGAAAYAVGTSRTVVGKSASWRTVRGVDLIVIASILDRDVQRELICNCVVAGKLEASNDRGGINGGINQIKCIYGTGPAGIDRAGKE
jgi:hypothetical protein